MAARSFSIKVSSGEGFTLLSEDERREDATAHVDSSRDAGRTRSRNDQYLLMVRTCVLIRMYASCVVVCGHWTLDVW